MAAIQNKIIITAQIENSDVHKETTENREDLVTCAGN